MKKPLTLGARHREFRPEIFTPAFTALVAVFAAIPIAAVTFSVLRASL